MNAKAKPTMGKQPNIPKGFVLVNLATWEQEALRRLAHENGIELRGALRNALTQMYQDLTEASAIRRRTGMDYKEQCRFFLGGKPKLN